MRYDTRYLIVTGVAWIRTTRVELADGRTEDSVWAVTFDDGLARKAPRAGSTIERGAIGDFAWDVTWEMLAAPFTTPHSLLRPFSPTRLVTTPAIVVNGTIGGRAVAGAAGHTASLSGARHARTWSWAHASDAHGRWRHLLTVDAPPFPRLSQYASDRRGPGLPFARARIAPPRVEVGPYAVEAPPESFVGLEYLDTDGSSVWCYHSEAATLDDLPAAFEIASREPIDGWRIGA